MVQAIGQQSAQSAGIVVIPARQRHQTSAERNLHMFVRKASLHSPRREGKGCFTAHALGSPGTKQQRGCAFRLQGLGATHHKGHLSAPRFQWLSGQRKQILKDSMSKVPRERNTCLSRKFTHIIQFEYHSAQTNKNQTNNKQTDAQTDKQPNKQTNNQTNRQTTKQTNKQTNRQTNRQTHPCPCKREKCL